jgi:hypothetical protein
MSLSTGEFRENRCSESHALLKGVVKFFPFCRLFHPSLIKLGVGDVDKSLLCCGRFRENRRSKSRAVLRSVSELLSVLFIFTDRFQ